MERFHKGYLITYCWCGSIKKRYLVTDLLYGEGISFPTLKEAKDYINNKNFKSNE